ncbi:MAG: 4-alpha-glucanotransferase [Chloroflexota bacterium]
MEVRNSVETRASGVLAHPTSLAGPHGIGDLGADAYRFVDFLAQAGQQIWQILPLGHPGHGDSPYAALSAFAGNPLLVSLTRLLDEGLLAPMEIAEAPSFAPDRVDYAAVAAFKEPRFHLAYERFAAYGAPGMREEFTAFRQREASWLDDYALFLALKEERHGVAWCDFGADLVHRRPVALAEARERLAPRIEETEFIQFQFFRQWAALKRYANDRGVRILGDIPIFVAYDSADVWANQGLFYLDANGAATAVAGVPPDIFSATGQRWGNPLYRWDRLAESGYAWWIERFRETLTMVDLVRLDHFRGFVAYWEVPASEPTAEHGRWVPGPGIDLFAAATKALGELPIVIEDLGLITEDVVAAREALGYPGMKVLQFAFGDDFRNPYLPHNYVRNCVVYTGTHDNDTTWGWFNSLPEWQRNNVLAYLGRDGHDADWDLIRLALMSVAEMAIFPLQDVLGLGGEARMNFPGRSEGNWGWRVRVDQMAQGVAERLADLTGRYGRRRT